MAEIIKDITANWNWEGDEFALQGFNIKIEEEVNNNYDNLDNGLVGFWKLDGDLNDYSTNNYNLDNHGSLEVSGLGQKSYFFDENANSGNGAYLYADVLGYPNDNITVSAWIHPEGHTDGRAPIVRLDQFYFQHYSNDRLATYWYGWDSQGYHYSNVNSVSDYEWSHVAVSWSEEGIIKFYVNGELDKVIEGVGNGGGNNLDWVKIGQEVSYRKFNGKIQNIRVYNRPLDDLEIKQIFKKDIPKSKSIVETFADSPKTTGGDYDYTYDFKNINLDKDKDYRLWVQAVYPGFDSLWVDTAGKTAVDDGTATIEDSNAFQQKMENAYENSKYFSKAHLIDDDDAHIFHFDKHLTSTKGLEPEAGYEVTIREDGKHNRGIAVEKGTYNYIPNGSFKNGEGITSESGSWGEYEIGKISNPIYDSEYVLKQKTGEYEIHTEPSNSLNPSTTYTISCWVAHTKEWDGDDQIFHCRWWNTDGSNNSMGGNGILIDTLEINGILWEWRYANFTTGELASGRYSWYLGYSAQGTKGWRYLTGIQLEEGENYTSFTEETRANGSLKYNSSAIDTKRGTLNLWIKPHDYIYSDTSYIDVIDCRTETGGTNNFIILRKNANSSVPDRMFLRSGASWNYSNVNLPPNDWSMLTWTWDVDGNYNMYFNGTNVKTGNYTESDRVPFGYIDIKEFGLMDEVLILKKAVDQTIIQSWYEMDKPFVDLHPKTNTNTPTNVVLTEV